MFSKAENIPNAAFSQAIPPAFLNWHGKATFLYVCSVGAIGEKKKNGRWHDSEYEDGYRDWRLKYNSDHRSLPSHNIIPCGRVMDKEIRAAVSDSLYATGIPSVEDEINYYVRRYANYKKCVNGQELLQKALALAKSQLENQKKELAATKAKKEEEQKEKRQELIAELTKVEIKSVNVQSVIEQYQGVLDEYCSTVLPEIISIWDAAQKSKKPKDYILEHMQRHCNENLYKEAYEGPKGIQRQIVDILSSCANEYKAKLQAVVKGREGILSEVAQEEISDIFLSIKTPDFDSVGKGNPLFTLFDWFPFLRYAFEKKFLEDIADSICKQLRHQKGGLLKKDKLGMFAEHCIHDPVEEYYKQLKKWKTTHLKKIKETLDKDNYILSQFDAFITNLERQIQSLETRLWNLTDVDKEYCGEVHIGKIHHMHHDEEKRVDLNKGSLSSHVFITGSTGSGKSNAVYTLLDSLKTTFMVIEPAKGEYKYAFTDIVKVYGSNPNVSELLRINPFAFNREIHVYEHIDRLLDVFNVCWPMYAAMPAVLKDAIIKAYESCGWNLITSENKRGEIYPTFIDVCDEIDAIINESDYSDENKGNYRGSLKTRLNSLTNGINQLIFCNGNLSDKDLFEQNTIIDLSRIGSNENKSLIMGLLVVRLQEYRMSEGAFNSDLRHVTVLEEAHNLLRRASQYNTEEGSGVSKII